MSASTATRTSPPRWPMRASEASRLPEATTKSLAPAGLFSWIPAMAPRSSVGQVLLVEAREEMEAVVAHPGSRGLRVEAERPRPALLQAAAEFPGGRRHKGREDA